MKRPAHITAIVQFSDSDEGKGTGGWGRTVLPPRTFLAVTAGSPN